MTRRRRHTGGLPLVVPPLPLPRCPARALGRELCLARPHGGSSGGGAGCCRLVVGHGVVDVGVVIVVTEDR